MIPLRCILLFITFAARVAGFQNLIPIFQGFGLPKQLVPKTFGDTNLENQLLEAIAQTERLSTSEEIDSIVAQLERSDKTLPRPSIAPQIYGRWRLLHTSNAATASPIQRKAVDASKFAIYQDITLKNENASDDVLIVSQVVKFSDTAELRVDALASTVAYPLEELTDRKSTGKVLGLNILGVSLVGDEAAPDPNRPDSRIDFVFDEGNFQFGDLKIPYPVPFRLPLFRDWVKGWIDITYLSDRMRISRGNKGTTFVLLKEQPEV
jgi:hypothetical protein